MNGHQYILEPYKGKKTRHICPDCQKRNKTFVRYVDIETGAYIAEDVGRCNREVNCGYHYPPKQYFEDNKEDETTKKNGNQYTKVERSTTTTVLKPQPVTYIPTEMFRQSLQHYQLNNLATFLINLFGIEVVKALIDKYPIGTSKHWPGATVFWQIDKQGRVRTGKIMQYNPDTGKRVKERINWVHSVTKQSNFNLKQCLFGEHLLKNNTKPVAIVESEKTALIASVYLPQFIWLTVGSLTNLTLDKCRVLQGRNVVLYPDLNGFEKWNTKAKELSNIANLTVSDLLERKATEREKEQGLDLADFLIRYDYRDFAKVQPNETEKEQTPAPPSPYIPFDEYVSQLWFDKKPLNDDKLLMADGYPACTDFNAPYLDKETKDFIKLVNRNPAVLKLQQRLGLTLSTNSIPK